MINSVGDVLVIQSIIFKLIIQTSSLSTYCETDLQWLSQNLIREFNNGSGNGLVSLGNKHLPEPIYHHMASLDHNELKGLDCLATAGKQYVAPYFSCLFTKHHFS